MKKAFMLLAVVGVTLFGIGPLAAAEKITLKYPGGSVRGDVVRVDKQQVVIKNSSGKEKPIPLILLKPADIYNCRKQLIDVKDAKSHFDLGEYCYKNGLTKQAKDHFHYAVSIEPDTYRAKVEALTGAAPASSEPVAKKKEPEAVKPVEDPAKGETAKKEPEKSGDDDGFVEVKGPNGKTFRIPKRFMASKMVTKAKTPAEVKEFQKTRLKELKDKVKGEWRFEETKHFYMFSNVEPTIHMMFKNYNEALYDKLCDVLDHKEGDKLWHNKCPIYYFKTHRQFQVFAASIDGSPGAGMSGGYFMHQGRDVHIAIPFYSQRGEKERVRTAFNTLCHEGTHAFLQLMGEDKSLSRWLHEGVAQFIEFIFDDMVKDKFRWSKYNRDKESRLGILKSLVQRGDILNWDDGKMRPMGGMDTVGYAFAWTRIEFLYRYTQDKRKLPQMIKLIKKGKTDEEAMEKVWGKPSSELEADWETWLRFYSKKGFKF